MIERVAFAETGRFIDTPVKRYSSGMYVRLAFAVVAHLEPDALFVDEVLAVGDAAFQKKCLKKMGEVANQGRTVIFISHNMIAVNSLCKRVVWLDNGSVVDDGVTSQVISKYLSNNSSNILFEEVWQDVSKAPGNDTVRLHRLYVEPSDNKSQHQITMQTPFKVIVEYWNLQANSNLHITLHLYTEEGAVAFTTGSQYNRSMPAGLFRSICHVPGDLLNSGQHRFMVLVVKDTSSVIFNYESRVVFDVVDLREREGSWYGREPGVVQPVLNWTTEYLKESDNTS